MLGCLSLDIIEHYLFLVAHNFPRTSLWENCSLFGTDNVRGQISEHIFAPNGDYCLYAQSLRSGSFIFKMAAMLQIPRVLPCVSCLGSAKADQCPRPGPKIGDKSQQIPCYSPVCPWGQPLGWLLISA